MDRKVKGNVRKTLLVNPRFQLTFLAYMVGMSAIAIFIFYCANIYFFWKFRQTGMTLGLPVDHVFFQFISEQRHTMDIVFGVTSIVVLLVLCASGLILSHLVAGPLHRLRKHFSDIASGKTTANVKFRRRDFFPEIADGFNEAVTALREKSGKEK